MADVITNTKTVLVRLTSDANDNRSINLDYPRDNLTLAEIKQAFQPMLNMKLLVGNKGDILNAVESATITTTQKVKLGDSEIEITVTPSAFIVQDSNPSHRFEVTGSNVIGGYFTNLKGNDSQGYVNYTKIFVAQNETALDVEVKFTDMPTSVSGTLNIVTQARTIQIPVQLYTP